MSTTAAKQAGGNEKVDGGTVVNGGTPASDSPITDVLNPNELATGSEYGSTGYRLTMVEMEVYFKILWRNNS